MLMPLISKKPRMDAQQVRLVWGCDPDKGTMWWIQRGRARKLGKHIGHSQEDGRGYLIHDYRGKRYYMHHLVWAWVHGRWPIGVIDHINRDPSDNRICNLRETTQARNLVNKPVRHTSTSGRKGVYLDPRDGRHYAYLDFEGRRISLGGFDKAESAYEARICAEFRYYGEVMTERSMAHAHPARSGP